MPTPISIPDPFAQAMREVHGPAGEAWVRDLPTLLADLCARWSLTLHDPFPLSYNYVAPATRADGAPAVLKVGVPHPELLREIDALRLCEGQGMVRLLDAIPERGALLLERLLPGTTLLDLHHLDDDDQATRIAASVMRDLWHPLPDAHPFRPVAAWAAGLGKLRPRFGGGTGPLPAPLVARAEARFAELLASSGPSVLLHGDLHHENILTAGPGAWRAIDPKGVTGEPEYEVGALIRNPLPGLLETSDPARVLARRFDLLADLLGFDRARLLGWSYAQAVLSAWWTIEDHGHGWEPAIAVADLLVRLGA